MLLLFFWMPWAAQAAPYLPKEDGEILEKLPVSPLDPRIQALRQLRQGLVQDPGNLRLAALLARRYIEQGRAQSDPRYFGYAQGVLSPWWNLGAPPLEALVLKATIRQTLHDFDGALADLNQALSRDPRISQARLTRAVIYQVKGEYAAAKKDCLNLMESSDSFSGAVCWLGASASAGELRESRGALEPLLGDTAPIPPEERLWAQTILAETALRLGDEKSAESYFFKALRLNPGDPYLLGSYADFLLDQRRYGEVVKYLKDQTRVDGLLLRLALAEKALNLGEDFSLHRQWLSDRFAAARQRGDSVHRREEARFRLHVSGETQEALRLAKENWGVQRESADLRILLETALKAGDGDSVKTAAEWMRKTGFKDLRLEGLLPSLEAHL